MGYAVCTLDPEYLKVAVKNWHPQRVYFEMRRINMRFLLFLLESVIPPNLQASYIGLEKAMSHGRTDFQQTRDYYTFCSVILSVVVGFLYIWGEFGNIEKLYWEIFTPGRNRVYRGQLRRPSLKSGVHGGSHLASHLREWGFFFTPC